MKTVFLFLLTAVFASTSFAGNMKDILFDHEESISAYLFDRGFELKSIRNSRFTPALPGYVIAITSEVEAYTPQLRGLDLKICTSQFIGDYRSGFDHVALDCQ